MINSKIFLKELARAFIIDYIIYYDRLKNKLSKESNNSMYFISPLK